MIKKLSFRKKLYLSFFTLNLVLLFACSAVFYTYTTNSLKQNMHDTLIGNTSMLSKDLDNLIQAADNSLKELQTNKSLISEAKNILSSSDNYFSSNVLSRSLFTNAFRSVLFSQNLYDSINYVSRYYDHLGVSTKLGVYSYLAESVLKDQSEITDLLFNTRYVTYVLPHEDYFGHSKTVFSVVRSMRDTYKSYGILILDFDITSLTDLLADFENTDDYSITLLDEEKNLVYTSDETLDHDLFLSHYQESARSSDTGTFSADTARLSCFTVSPVTGWTFILNTMNSGYLQSMKELLMISALLFFSLFLLMALFLFIMTSQLSKPIRELSNQLMHLKPGQNIQAQRISGSSEITILTNSVQGFLAEIYDQNQRLTEARRRTLQAHYDAMEAQLNPHFLYNTLSVISMAGLNSGNTTVSKMCSELASLLRYSLSYTGQSVCLAQEITNGKSYLYIMKMRYEEDLIYEWQLDSSLDEIHVPKLILQPLIENCFQHGFHQPGLEIAPPWFILIRTWQDETYWYLSIANNGTPFSKEKQELLSLRIGQFQFTRYEEENLNQELKRQGFGLENTILRLNIYYHGAEYFRIEAGEENGTIITIGGPRIPGSGDTADSGRKKG